MHCEDHGVVLTSKQRYDNGTVGYRYYIYNVLLCLNSETDLAPPSAVC
jgi:hypothetical protein